MILEKIQRIYNFMFSHLYLWRGFLDFFINIFMLVVSSVSQCGLHHMKLNLLHRLTNMPYRSKVEIVSFNNKNYSNCFFIHLALPINGINPLFLYFLPYIIFRNLNATVVTVSCLPEKNVLSLNLLLTVVLSLSVTGWILVTTCITCGEK